MRNLIAVTLINLVPAIGASQGQPGTNLTLQVHISAVTMAGDTTRVDLMLHNDSTSQEDLRRFTAEAPAPVLWISLPAPSDQWTTATRAKTLSVARWATLEPVVLPGTDSPVLSFRAIGLPTIVRYWAGGRFPTPDYEYQEPAPPLSPTDALGENAILGKTVGIEPLPDSITSDTLVGRLRNLTDQACGVLGWISSSSICASLDSSLDASRTSLGQGNTSLARTQLNGYLATLQSQFGPGLPVNESAYWLLQANAQYILARLS